jgi:hypothetical protein
MNFASAAQLTIVMLGHGAEYHYPKMVAYWVTANPHALTSVLGLNTSNPR